MELSRGDACDSPGGADHGTLLAEEPPYLAGWLHYLESFPSVAVVCVCSRINGLELDFGNVLGFLVPPRSCPQICCQEKDVQHQVRRRVLYGAAQAVRMMKRVSLRRSVEEDDEGDVEDDEDEEMPPPPS